MISSSTCEGIVRTYNAQAVLLELSAKETVPKQTIPVSERKGIVRKYNAGATSLLRS